MILTWCWSSEFGGQLEVTASHSLAGMEGWGRENNVQIKNIHIPLLDLKWKLSSVGKIGMDLNKDKFRSQLFAIPLRNVNLDGSEHDSVGFEERGFQSLPAQRIVQTRQ